MQILYIVLTLFYGLAWAHEAKVFSADVTERQSRISALVAAYDAMDRGRLDSQDKIIVIKETGGKIVVSFLNKSGERVYGGQAHVTYDPIKQVVEEVEAED